MELITFLRERGLFSQYINEDIFNKGNFTFYLGIDATANSLHLGNLLCLRVAKIMQDYGNNVIILMGGATTRIGDPTGKVTERKVLPSETVKNNINEIEKLLSKFFKNYTLVNNSDWLDSMGYMEMLEDFARHISINRLVKLETIQKRLENHQNLSFLELNYPLLQSIDFVILNRKYNCTVQIGGSDQWGNIVSGVELAQRVDKKDLGGLTIPLLLKQDGMKMGKSEEGTVWLNKPYELWHFLRSIEDESVERFLLAFTSDSIEFIQKKINENINEAKVYLADSILTWLHGPESLENIKKTTEILLKGTRDIKETPIEMILQLSLKDFEGGLGLEDLLIITGISPTKADAKQKITSGQVKINNISVCQIDILSLKKDPLIKLSYGKKIHKVVEFIL